MGSPVIFITIGTLPLATALSSTGADVLLADVFNKLTGGLSPVMTMVLMYLVCCVLTQFITNSAVNNAFKMLAALICVQNGYDARALMLSTNEGSANCYLFPAAAPAMTMGFEAGGYTLKQHFKQECTSRCCDSCKPDLCADDIPACIKMRKINGLKTI